MRSLKRDGNKYIVDAAPQIFDGSSTLAKERKRLFLTTFRSGQSLRTILRHWAPLYREIVDARRAQYVEEEQRNPASVLQIQSLAWHSWAAENPDAAEQFQHDHITAVWDSYHVTQLATFLATTHAVHEVGLIKEIEGVVKVRGEGRGAGTSQYRLSVVLASTGLNALFDTFGRPDHQSIHPGYPTSFRENREDPPRIQICTRKVNKNGVREWKRSDRCADVDIDYRSFGEGHLSPRNSDVTGKVRTELHIERHERGYGQLSGLGVEIAR